MQSKKFKSVDEYISSFPEEVHDILQHVRDVIKETARGSEELISYNMPAFRLNGLLVWYAGNKNHIGLYPKPSAIKFFEKELAGYKTSKGAIQFPLDKKMPDALIKKIIKFRMKENAEGVKKK
ncbi:MAG: DUF1801 domain-containing protein [Bacteroidetes bacterium]|nr:DUF1801 domain-containing protein [Bacteroidota bacterium]MBS1934354.1 DUF1801 domain-containing protein [Bacteroidota bacterium]